jgi:hypothetical protein
MVNRVILLIYQLMNGKAAANPERELDPARVMSYDTAACTNEAENTDHKWRSEGSKFRSSSWRNIRKGERIKL